MSTTAPLDVLTCAAPSLVAALHGGYFRRAGVRVTAVAHVDALVAAATRIRPAAVIMVAGAVDPRHERQVARELHTCRAGGGALVLLALPPEREAIAEDLTLFDGVVALSAPELDLIRALAPVIAAEARRAPRVTVSIPTLLFPLGRPTVSATAVDLSSTGAGLRLFHSAVTTVCMRAVFYRSAGRQVRLTAQPIWTDAPADRPPRLGVRFLEATLADVQALYDLGFWWSERQAGGRVVCLEGDLTEATSFATLLEQVGATPVLDLARLGTANAAGLERWSGFLAALPARLRLRLRRVPVRLAPRLAPEQPLTGRCVIESLLVSYECPPCRAVVRRTEQPGARSPGPCCTRCGRPTVTAVGAHAMETPAAELPIAEAT